MTIGERFKYARKKNGLSQNDLANLIGVSRGVITNIEYDKIDGPQQIIVDAICQALAISKEWLLEGSGEMENKDGLTATTKVLADICDGVKELSEKEQLFILDTIKAFKLRFK